MANDDKRPIAVDNLRCPDCGATLAEPYRLTIVKRNPKTGDIESETLEPMADFNLRLTTPQEAACGKCAWAGHVTFGRRV